MPTGSCEDRKRLHRAKMISIVSVPPAKHHDWRFGTVCGRGLRARRGGHEPVWSQRRVVPCIAWPGNVGGCWALGGGLVQLSTRQTHLPRQVPLVVPLADPSQSCAVVLSRTAGSGLVDDKLRADADILSPSATGGY